VKRRVGRDGVALRCRGADPGGWVASEMLCRWRLSFLGQVLPSPQALLLGLGRRGREALSGL